MLRTLFIGVVSQRALILFLAIIVAATGMLAWRELPIDAFPDVTNVQVMILTDSPGMAPIDVERQVTYPIELDMAGLPNVKLIRSLSKAELSLVVVVFEDDTDIYFARQLVFERLQSAREKLPDWAEPELGPVSTGLGEIYQYTLESDSHSLMELRTIQDWLVAPMLRPLKGVTEVNTFGGFIRQYQILVDPIRLEQYGIDVRDVVEAMAANNANTGGGYIVKGEEQAYVRCVGLLNNVEDIANVVLKAKDGTPVLVRDIADVTKGRNLRQGAVTRDGSGEVVCGMVILLKDANSRKVVNAVKKTIPAVQAALPKGVKINTWYDRTSLIQECVSTISSSIENGAILVIFALLLLLGSLRTAIVVIVSLPFTALITFIAMKALGITANLMSLGGLAVAIGMVVDSSIMVAENMLRRLGENDRRTEKSLLRAAVRGCMEVARPLLFAEAIIIVTFIPLLTLVGMEGKMFHPLAKTLCIAIVGSVISAFTVIPAMAAVLLRGATDVQDGFIFSHIRHAYLWLLHTLLKTPRLTLLVSIAAFVTAVLTIPHLGTEFIPTLDEGAFAVNVVRLSSSSLNESVRQCTFLENEFLKIPEVTTIVSKTGRAAISEDPMGPEQSDLFIMLKDRSQWRKGMTKEKLRDELAKGFAKVPGTKPAFSQPIALRVNELISGIKSELAIKVFGPDLDELVKQANRVSSVIRDIPGAQDVKVEQVTGFPQLDITLDRKALAQYHLNADEVAAVVEAALAGKAATTLVEGQARFDVVVRLKDECRRRIEMVGRLLIKTPDGLTVPLRRLARIRELEAPAMISRENGNRRVVVEVNIGSKDIGGFVKEAQKRLALVKDTLPAGYWLEYGGTFENQKRAMERLSVVVPLSVTLIFVMLLAAFGSMRTAVLVLANLPFALIGGVATAYLTGTVLSVPAIVGFIALFGTSTQDGVVLVSFINDLRRAGKSMEAAVIEGCSLRLRSVVLTSVTTILGLVPLSMAVGAGAEVQRPLALVVLGGMASALLLVLLVLPVMYSLWPPEMEQES